MKKNIFIIASGTGGHVIPAKIISYKLIAHNYKVTWIGTKAGIENKLINDPNINIHHINSTGVRGKNLFQIIKGIINLVKSFYQSLVLIYKEQPKFVIGFGGYVSVPVSIAAFIMRVPVYAHEANSVAGTSNKINNLISKVTFQTFPNTFRKNKNIILSGNPIDQCFSDITQPEIKYKKQREILNILIFGGSQGSSFFNKSIPKCLNRFTNKFSIKHLSGYNNKDLVEKHYKDKNKTTSIIEFSNKMHDLYEWSDIIISRAGSMTITEISKAGRVAILVPYLYATDNHQHVNARYLANNQAAIIIEENDYFERELYETLEALHHNQERLSKLSLNCKNLFPDNSSAIILNNITELDEEFNNTTS